MSQTNVVVQQSEQEYLVRNKKTTENIIVTKNLSKIFNGRTVLNQINLHVPKNSIFGFLGPNGAGKTTTMKIILGLLKPTSGSVQLFNKDISAGDFRSRIGFLAQQPHFYNSMTAREILNFRARFFPNLEKNWLQNRIEESLDIFELQDIANHRLKGYSGGERQRVGIALAQLTQPELLILDEPVSALDPIGRYSVLKIMEKLKANSTIFYSTHILDDVQKVSDTVAIVNKGKLIAQAPIEELLNSTNGFYKVKIKPKGDTTEVLNILRSQSFVKSLDVDYNHSYQYLKISITDESEADKYLLPILVDRPEIIIKEYGFQEQELEEIFMNLINGGT